MTTKRKSLQDAFSEKRSLQPQVEGVPPPQPVTPSESNPAPVQASRRGKKFVGGYFAPEVARQLKHLAVEHDKTVQELVTEAVNDLFQKYGKPYIA